MTGSRRLPFGGRLVRRALATGLLGATLVGGLAACGGGDDENAYKVRAIFDNASFVIPGLDVKVAGVNVGEVTDVELTDDNRAAVTFTVDDPGFQDFREDATCSIRPQALIGERFVECTLTEPRPAGASAPRELAQIAEGEHAGAHLLPVEQTSVPVDADEVLAVQDASTRERFAIIIRELGAGVAGRGEEINKALRRANPTLTQANRLLRQLDAQKQTLVQLADTSDRVLTVLANERASIEGAVTNGATVMRRLSSRRSELRETITQLDRLLGEVPGSVDRLTELTDELTPITRDLARNADDMATVLDQLPTLASRGAEAMEALGPVTDQGREVLVENQQFWDRIVRMASVSRTSLSVLGLTLGDFRSTGGLDYFMDAIFGLAMATNGRDAGGSYLRATALSVLACSLPTQISQEGCGRLSRFANEAANSASAGARAFTKPPAVKADAAATTPRSGGRDAADATTPQPADAAAATTPPVDEQTAKTAADMLLGGEQE